jgi:hypothetical protein
MFRPEDTMIARSIGGFVVATAVVARSWRRHRQQRGGGGPQHPTNARLHGMGMVTRI